MWGQISPPLTRHVPTVPTVPTRDGRDPLYVPLVCEPMFGTGPSGFPRRKGWRVSDRRWRVFFAAWDTDPDSRTGVLVAGTWRNAWRSDDRAAAEALAERLNALEPGRWVVTDDSHNTVTESPVS